MLKITQTKNELEKFRLYELLKSNHTKAQSKLPHRSEYRVVLSREIDENLDVCVNYIGNESKLYQYVSDRCFFDFCKNIFVERDDRLSLAKIGECRLDQIDSGDTSKKEYKAKLINVIHHLLEIFEMHPFLVIDQLRILDFVVLMEDHELYVYFLTVTKNYFKLQERIFDVERVYQKRLKDQNFKHLILKYNKQMSEMYTWYQKIILEEKSEELFLTK